MINVTQYQQFQLLKDLMTTSSIFTNNYTKSFLPEVSQ